MDGFYNLNTPFSQPKTPTSVELSEIKQMLSSGVKNQVLQAVEKIKPFTNEEESLCEIIRADIAEFLCDAVKSSDTVTLSSIYNCLGLMEKHLEFYTQNHVSFVIESIIRSLNFLMKDSDNVNLNQPLNLLALILQGYNTHGVMPEQKTVENLLLLLPELEKTLTPTTNSKYQIGLVILNMIELRVSKWSHKANHTILNCFCKWFNFLRGILESEHPMKEKLTLLCSTLCHSVIRFLVSNENSEEEFYSEIEDQLKNDILFNVYVFLTDFGAPYFDNAIINEVEIEEAHLENFYNVILYFYSDNLSYKNRLAHGLSKAGFLQFTARIISVDEISDTQKLPKLCRFVLYHIILSLSENVFDVPEVWPSGSHDFRTEIQKGMEELPLDVSQWLDALNSPQFTSSCKFALLLYLYFYCMTAGSVDLLQSIYPAIVTFLHTYTGIEKSVLLIKTVWLIFVMSQMSVAKDVFFCSETNATERIASLLGTVAKEDFGLVYTHNPAILYWAFSYNVNSNIQTSVVDLWLRNKTSGCTEVEKLIKKSSDVRCAVLEILQNGKGQSLDSAFSSVKSILQESEDDDLASDIWFLLPKVLANFTTNAILVTNVDYLIQLCNMKCPTNFNVTRNTRIPSLLSEVLLKSDLISVVPLLTLALNLLRMDSNVGEYWTVPVFLRSEDFVKKIIDGLSVGNPDISLCSIHIVTILWKDCGNVKNTEAYGKIKISKETVLQVLQTNSEESLSAALDFIHRLLVSNFQSTFSFIENPDLEFVEVLFLEVQNICIKTSSELSEKCWWCLKLFLTFDVPVNELHLELCTHPVIYELIRVFLPQLKDSSNMADFLIVWIDLCRNMFQNPCYERRIFGQFYEETLKMIADTIMKDYTPERQHLLEKVLSSGVIQESRQS